MAENSQTQQILVPFDFSEAANNAIVYAMELARLFKCEITIFYTVNKKNGKLNVNEDGSENTIKQKLSILANNLIADYTIAINVYMFTGEVHEIIHKIYPKINAIALIVGLNSKKSRMHFFTSNTIVTNYRDLRIPLIVVRDELPRKTIYRHIILPLDFNRESKEKAAWSGYISTLNKSTVYVLSRNYKDAYFAASLRTNIVLVDKLFNNLGVAVEFIKEPDITVDIDKYAVEYAWLNQGDIVVVMATKEISIDDLIMGLKEKRIIENKYKLPIMLINPRDDLYLPCGC